MDRRWFLRSAALAGMAALPRGSARVPALRLRAFVNSGMPETLAIPASLSAAPLFEARIYAAGSRVEETLRAAGIEALPCGERCYLIPFASLSERAEAWARVNSLPGRTPAGAYRFALYRRVSEISS